jgi:hypothetical protein
MADTLVDSQLDLLDAAADAKLDAPTSAEDAQPQENVASAPSKPKNLYFVRVPRPQIDEAPVKDLQTKLAATLTKLKEYNSKLAGKRVRCGAAVGDRHKGDTFGGARRAAGVNAGISPQACGVGCRLAPA